MRFALATVLALHATTGAALGGGLPAPLAAPELTTVGSGISGKRTTIPSAYTNPGRGASQSLWRENDRGLFRDTTAHKVGDVVTVSIDINDKAQFDNQSGRSRSSSTKIGANGIFGFNIFGRTGSGEASAGVGANAESSSKGSGNIDRSERLRLSVAAIVTEVLPNGNLLISGSQEVRVNYEIRVLTVAGIVRTTDITSANAIAYDKIAEARISYGGRGRITDVQQPNWGQRIVDKVSPY